MRHKILFLAASALALGGCIERDLEESVEVLQAGAVGYAVVADNYSGDTVTDTVKFYSNRSWSARIVPEDCDWLEIEVSKHSNFSRTTDMVSIPMKFKNNELDEDRLANIVFTTRDGEYRVPIRQYAINPRLEILSGAVVPDILCDSDSSVVRVKSNVSWSVSQDLTKSNTVVEFVKEGLKDGEFFVKFPTNTSYLETKVAVINVTGRKCEPRKITFIQNSNKPFIRIGEVPEKFPAWVPANKPFHTNTATLNIQTNSTWVLDTTLVSGFKGLSFNKTSGDENDTAIVVTYSDNLSPNPYCEGSVQITLRTTAGVPGVEEGSVTFNLSQEAAAILYMNNGTSNTSVTLWDKIFSTPDGNTFKTSSSKAVIQDEILPLVTKTGYTWYAYAKGGFYRNTTQGLALSGNSYLVFPKIPGKRLVSVTAQNGNGTYTYYITTRDKVLDNNAEDAVGGGAAAAIKKGENYTWYLTDTDADTEYCITRPGALNMFFQYIDLRYE